MKALQIKNIIKENYSTIHSLYGRIVKNFNAEDIRLFRIEVKKLKALLSMFFESSKAASPISLPAKLLKFYKAIGNVRSFQLQRQRIVTVFKNSPASIPESYLLYLNVKIDYSSRLAEKLNKQKHPFKRGEQHLLKLDFELSPSGIKEFIRVKQRNIDGLLVPFFQGDDTLHAIRKVLKDLLHLWPQVKRSTPKKKLSIFKGREDIKVFAQLLGKFQDIRSQLNLLHSYDPNLEKSKKGKIFLIDFESTLKEQKEILRKEISKLFQKRIQLE